MKNQEKTQEKIQKKNIPQQQKQQNLQRQHIQHFLREYNTCQVQPKFEHEIFQPNVRPLNSKESSFKNTSEEDLCKCLVFGSTTYLKGNCCMKIVLPKSGLSRGLAFITAPDYVLRIRTEYARQITNTHRTN